MTQPGQRHRYCSNACKQQAYRDRNPQAKLLRILPKLHAGDLQGAFNRYQIEYKIKHFHDWQWKGAVVVRRAGAYYLEPGQHSFKSFDGTYLGKTFEKCIRVFVEYLKTGKENAAFRRAR